MCCLCTLSSVILLFTFQFLFFFVPQNLHLNDDLSSFAMPCHDYSSSCDSTADGLPKEQQTSREWVLEWNRKSDTSEVQEYLQQIQRSHSHSQPDSNSDSPSGSFARSSSVPRYAAYDGQVEEQMESEPFEIQNLSCSPNRNLMDMRQTLGEVTSDDCIADNGRGNQRNFVSTFVHSFNLSSH